MAPNQKVQSFPITLPPELAKYYIDRNKELGAGGFAKVILAEHAATGEKVAIKVMNKTFLSGKDDLHRAYNEIYALKHLSHQNVCQLYEVFECTEFIYLVIEYCPGGELFDYIVSKKRLPEREARCLFRQILSAVAYIHKNGYAHRDLKPENMLLDTDKKIKIIDFGLSAKPEKGLKSPLRTRAGSALYASPELISGEPYYGNETDVWSLGVVLYALLCGFLPFDHEATTELYKKIKKGDFVTPPWLSQSSLKLLRSMMEVDPQQRISVEKILDHEWMMTGFEEPVAWQPKIQRNKLNFKAVQLIAGYFQWSLADTESKLALFKYNHLTAFYFIICEMSEKKLTTLRNAWLHRDNFLGEANTSLNGNISPDMFVPETRTRSKSSYVKNFLVKDHLAHQQRRRSNTSNSIDENVKLACVNKKLFENDLENNNRNSKTARLKTRSRSVENNLDEDAPKTRNNNITNEKHELKFRQRCSVAMDRLWTRGRIRSNTLDTILPSQSKTVVLTKSHRSKETVDNIRMQNGIIESEGDRSTLTENDKTNLQNTKRLAASCMDNLDIMRDNRHISQSCQKSKSLNNYSRVKSEEKRTRKRSIKDFTQRLSAIFKHESVQRNSSSEEGSPRRVKAMYHVENTSSLPPIQLQAELHRVLSIMVESDEILSFTNTELYLFKCKASPDAKTVFELEVCRVPMMENVMGIRRKRIKGNSWKYKELVERVLSLANI